MSDLLHRARRPWFLAPLLLGLAAVLGLAWTTTGHSSEPLQLTVAPAPESPDAAGAQALDNYMPSRMEAALARTAKAADLELSLPTAQTADDAIARIASGRAELWIGRLDPSAQPLPAGVRQKRLDWSGSPMVILRTDTDILDWADLQGRTVCVAADDRHPGRLARDFGALEQPYPVLANALVALRTGDCDAAVADESLLQQLLTYPEWEKFSARLLPPTREPLVALWSDRLAADQKRQIRRLISKSTLETARQTQARSIAFEVYLDQEAPDCHS